VRISSKMGGPDADARAPHGLGPLAIEHLADFASECLRTEWLVDERDSRVKDAVVDDRFVGVAGHVDDLQGRTSFHQLLNPDNS
jgi:hypothetical protein